MGPATEVALSGADADEAGTEAVGPNGLATAVELVAANGLAAGVEELDPNGLLGVDVELNGLDAEVDVPPKVDVVPPKPVVK
jgi:hypothetical protein